MKYNWDNYLSPNENVEMSFGISTTYTAGVLIVTLAISILLFFSNIIIGIATLILGLVYWYYLFKGKKYALTNKKIILIDSFLGRNIINISYDKITDISIDQNAIDMLGGWGSITINTAGYDTAEAFLQNVNNPNKIKNKIDELAEKAKR